MKVAAHATYGERGNHVAWILPALALVLALVLPTSVGAQSLTLSASASQLARLAADTPSGALNFVIDGGARTLLIDISSTSANLESSLQLPG